MNSSYKTRANVEALAEQLKSTANHKQKSAAVPLQQHAATGIYVITDGAIERTKPTLISTTAIISNKNSSSSNPPTMERQHGNRMSWTNMRRKGEEAGTTSNSSAITPSPQTTRSYVSTVSTGGLPGRGRQMGSSGRTTATSVQNSTSGCNTISGSNNTLNDIISDYHNHEVNGGTYHNSTTSPLKSTTSSFNLTNGSTAKLLPALDDESNQQTKCSVFRGLVLCVCLNLTYANVVRFPRELDKHGTAYLVPYLVLLFLVGLPIVLLELSVGQFLGQGAAHTWRASPIFKGATIICRFASWLSTIWISLQAVIAVGYFSMFLYDTIPFRECLGNIKIAAFGYTQPAYNGQECLEKTFLTPFWSNPLYFGLISIGLIGVWMVVMLCTHNGKVLRRSLFFLGLLGFFLLCALTGWEVHNSLERTYFPEFRPFDAQQLLGSNIWFNALMQVIFSTNCGLGVLPIITGKFLYKGDAVRTSVVYLCFNLLIKAIAVTLFMVQFGSSVESAGGTIIYELKPFTAIYDRVLNDVPSDDMLNRIVVPSLLFVLILVSTLVSLTVAIYTVTRLIPRHPNYVVGLTALVSSIIALSSPKFITARVLDTRIVATIAITALIFELIAITWIYGAKNIYTDLEFSIGRPILKGWMGLWCLCPAILTGLLVWWCSDDDQLDLLPEYMPRWAPIIFALAIIFIIACVQIFRQVEYNFFGMICEASKPAKEWGPADPLARHAWKQWRSVCADTGRRDFTLRRRGTRDYTHSIKKGQYSTAAHNGEHHHVNGHVASTQQQQNWKTPTPGNSSPNYSGSMFGDSAIEEDISVDKYTGITQQFVPFNHHHNHHHHQTNQDGKPLRYSQRAPAVQQRQLNHIDRAIPPPAQEKHREIVYIRRLSDDGQHATRIEIKPCNESSIIYGGGGTRNPYGKINTSSHGNSAVAEHNRNSVVNIGGAAGKLPPHAAATDGNGDHICWRKFTVNAAQYSTEL